MAAIGDSITLGVGADPTSYGVAPQYSWATGDASEGIVKSHYARLLELTPEIAGNHHNLARGGARMRGGPRQARRAAKLGVDYVTVFLGANDICRQNETLMTSLEDFEAQFAETLSILDERLPQAHVYVLSIPNLHDLWVTLRDNPAVSEMWRLANTCPALLATTNTEATRRTVRDRLLAFNDILATTSSRFERCRFDEDVVFEHAYTVEHLSADFFHPSHVGQSQLAETTWRNGYWS